MKPLNIHIPLWPVLYAMCSLAACSGTQSGPPLANGCREGSHMEDGECKADRTTEDCSQLEDLDRDGLVPSLDCLDCPALCSPLPDGGTTDGGFSQDGGMQAAQDDCSVAYCYLVSPYYYQEVDGGRVLYFYDPLHGPLVRLPNGPGITNKEVPQLAPRAVKVCYALQNDMDGDGVVNQQDNCWSDFNPPPGCLSDEGCVNAGGLCQNGVCSKQLDADRDGMGDTCDANPGWDDSELTKHCDPDSDNDAIPWNEDRCPKTVTSEFGNVEDTDMDGTPNVCDPCAFPEMSCQHG